MTYSACGDPPFPSVMTVTSVIGSGIIGSGTESGYWMDGVWYPTVTYPTHWYQPIYPQTTPLMPYESFPQIQPLKLPDMSVEKMQQLIEALQAGQFNPPPVPAQEAAPAPKVEPEPAQDLTRPFERKLDLD